MKIILGTKQNMTQIFDAAGDAHPVTCVQAGPIVVTQIKTLEKDGYDAVQVGFGEKREKLISKPVKGHLKDLGNFRYIEEFRMPAGDLQVGDTVNVSAFGEGDALRVSATSKGKGFQGVVKRYGFAGGRRTHGQKHSEREGGSIGSTGPARVFKGLRMPGRMGTDRVTVKNLTLMKVDADNNMLYIKGAVPGVRGGLVEIQG